MNATGLVAIAGGLMMVTAGQTTTYADDFERTIAVEPGGTLHVELDLGEIEIESHDENTVWIETRAGGWPWAVEFAVEEDGNDIRLVGTAVTEEGLLAQSARWAMWPFDLLHVDVRVRVPREYSVAAHTEGGDVDVSDLRGDARLRTNAGRIEMENVVGNVDAWTAGGRIEIEEVSGDVRAESGGGRIDIEAVDGAVAAYSAGGRIRVDEAAGEVVAVTGGGRIFASFTVAPAGKIETGGGRIEVRFPEAMGTNLTATTGGGRVRVDDDLSFEGEATPQKWQGMINGGGPALGVHTSGGRIKIRPL